MENGVAYKKAACIETIYAIIEKLFTIKITKLGDFHRI